MLSLSARCGVSHLFVHCPVANSIWDLFSSALHMSFPITDNIVLLWSAWFSSTKIQKQSNVLLAEFWHGDSDVAIAWGFQFTHQKISKITKVSWKSYMDHYIKLNTDGAAKGNLGCAGAGGVIRDKDGKMILGFSEYLGIHDNFYTELTAVVKGLEICIQKGYLHVWLETNASTIIPNLQLSSNGNWKRQPLISKFLALRRHLSIKVSHIFREGNRPEDFLASFASGMLQWIDAPPKLRGFLLADEWALPNFRFS